MSVGESLIGTARSAALVEGRRAVLPAGVTGAGRIDDPYTLVFTRGRGSRIWDVDGNEFLDYHGGYGTAILGYSHPAVDGAVAEAMADGRTFVGAAHVYEAALAERLVGLLPEADRVALCGGGGTDALYHAVRLARAATGRTKVVKVEGGYQGWHGVLGASTSPALTDVEKVALPPTISNSDGTLPSTLAEVLVVAINDLESLRARFERDGDEIAALVVEPVLYSSGCILVDVEYLRTARELCDRHGAVLVFDEILSGFRARLGGAGAGFGVTPDLATYGKAVANGHVLSLVAGRAELMDLLAPAGPVFYSGTFNGHPLACAAAQATLDELESGEVFAHVDSLVTRLADGVNAAAGERGLTAVCQHFGSGWTIYLGAAAVRDYRDLAAISDPETLEVNRLLRHWLRDRGIFMQHRKGTNRGFVSAAHDTDDIDRTIEVVASFLDAHADRVTR